MSVRIIYFVHGTTTDNERGLSTGWNPGELSELGMRQAKQLGALVADKTFDAFFCSDLKRAVDSAQLGFASKYTITLDKRLRESNYGDLNGTPEKHVHYNEHIETPFPNGESMHDVEKRMRAFLDDLKKNYAGRRVAILAHKAPQLALEVITNNKTWKQALSEDWRNTKSWQPGWKYQI